MDMILSNPKHSYVKGLILTTNYEDIEFIKNNLSLKNAYRLIQTRKQDGSDEGYGRSNRAEDDYAHTYILDKRFLLFVDQHKDYFPGWFIEAIQR